MKTGETIEYLRQRKNISLTAICGTEISRQNYYRISHDQVNTSITKFRFILEKLNVTFDEFYFIKENFNQEKIFLDYTKAQNEFENKNIQALTNMIKEYAAIKNNSTRELHLYCLLVILKKKLQHKSDETCEQILHDYLIRIETWTHYETVLFNNCMFIFSTDFINVVIFKTLSNLSAYSSLRSYGSESFRMLVNVLILSIDRHEWTTATSVLQKMRQITLADDLVFEHACLRFFNNLLAFIQGETTDTSHCEEVIQALKFLGSNKLALIFTTYLKESTNQLTHI
ncbi:Rgg/GadR/MutR family transcriptional regulator [Lactiplantibacillus brownii]|uniref:Rgg/GadR/MutR family transcriptional regulator n=1 Tax=Lactiplantibacillus brownii TaxID=3069269 RepID=UPI0038B31464